MCWVSPWLDRFSDTCLSDHVQNCEPIQKIGPGPLREFIVKVCISQSHETSCDSYQYSSHTYLPILHKGGRFNGGHN